SQRHSPHHPLSRILTHRKKITRRKAALRQERFLAKTQSQMIAVDSRAQLGSTADSQGYIETYLAAWNAAAASHTARVVDETQRTLATLHELAATARSKRVREQARRKLERYADNIVDPGKHWP